MFCPKCGIQLEQGSAVCPACGQPLSENAPVEVNPAVEAPAPTRPVGRTRFLFSVAPVKTKIFAVLSLLTAIVCIVLILNMHFSVQTTSVEEYPVVSVGMDMLEYGMDFDEIKGYINEGATTANEYYNEYADELPEELRATAEESIAILEDCAEELSPENLSRLLEALEYASELGEFEEFEELEEIEEFEKIEGFDQLEQINAVLDQVGDIYFVLMDILSWALLIIVMLAVAFTAFSGLFFLRVLTVFGLIFAELYAVLFSGPVLIAVFAALFIFLFVMQCLVKSGYKQYRRSF